MLNYAVKRLGLAVAIVSVAMFLLFCMIYLVPGDPASVALGPRATDAMKEALRVKMGLDQPIWVQFWNFFSGAWTGDLGQEVLSGRPVLDVVLEQLPFTLALIAGGITWSVAIGIPLGCWAAINRGSFADRLVGILSVAVIAVPSFVIAIYALLIFSVSLRWLPAIGAGEPGHLGDQIVHLILPSLAVGLGWVGYIARMVRASMLEVLEASHIRTARAFGLPENMITYRYALTIAILPTITLLGVGIGQMLSSAVFAEIVFARPGVGKLVYDAILTRNFPVVTGAVLVTTVIFVLLNLVADLIVGALDPRVRSSF
ncbi:peptide/nickel transport system permease protein [Cribrihabitans marinus]|uniref:Peptide/nickel transport system permease protein n=1 Tax=Cribrihabitans marinus TaxID=1227549 RepID=A0A1H6Q8V4_9RHOB|nr:ABC transporter permease [Cribrihabitans marinus]GGH18258.1 peptide ABC transporter permease [Cribrihabitans marinus]SEI40219.1 peptide/nickel transport system permease protein [Cribrihabitans marinus]